MRRVISLSLPEEMAEELDRLAEKLRSPKSGLVRDALDRFLLNRRLDEIRERLRTYALRGGVVADDDVFKQVS